MNNQATSKSRVQIILCFLLITFGGHSMAASIDSNIKRQEKQESNSLQDNTQGWKIVKADKKDNPTWVIYSRKIAGTNFLEYKIEGEVKSTASACMAWFKEDIHNLASDGNNKKYPTYDILEENQDSLLTYVIHNEPFPLKDTEMRVRYIFFKDEAGNTGVRWHEDWKDMPEQTSKKLSRVQSFRGSWQFSPMEGKACKVINSVNFDPQKMPLWLVEPMVFKFLKGGLKDIREMTEG